MPSNLLQDLKPARSPRIKNKAPAQPMSQPFGYPYMMLPPAAMYANHYSWLPPYVGGAVFFLLYFLFLLPQQQQAAFQTSASLSAGSSSFSIPAGDPDELIEGYFDWMIEKYPR